MKTIEECARNEFMFEHSLKASYPPPPPPPPPKKKKKKKKKKIDIFFYPKNNV